MSVAWCVATIRAITIRSSYGPNEAIARLASVRKVNLIILIEKILNSHSLLLPSINFKYYLL